MCYAGATPSVDHEAEQASSRMRNVLDHTADFLQPDDKLVLVRRAVPFIHVTCSYAQVVALQQALTFMVVISHSETQSVILGIEQAVECGSRLARTA